MKSFHQVEALWARAKESDAPLPELTLEKKDVFLERPKLKHLLLQDVFAERAAEFCVFALKSAALGDKALARHAARLQREGRFEAPEECQGV